MVVEGHAVLGLVRVLVGRVRALRHLDVLLGLIVGHVGLGIEFGV